MVLLHEGVPVVLDRVIRTTNELACDSSPLFWLFGLTDENDPDFFCAPLRLGFDQRIELVVPTLTTLLARASFDFDCDIPPFVGSMLDDAFHQDSVFGQTVPGFLFKFLMLLFLYHRLCLLVVIKLRKYSAVLNHEKSHISQL